MNNRITPGSSQAQSLRFIGGFKNDILLAKTNTITFGGGL